MMGAPRQEKRKRQKEQTVNSGGQRRQRKTAEEKKEGTGVELRNKESRQKGEEFLGEREQGQSKEWSIK